MCLETALIHEASMRASQHFEPHLYNKGQVGELSQQTFCQHVNGCPLILHHSVHT
jgi:hypothetical protein